MVRAVLEGIAQRGADLVDAAQRETGQALEEVRVDGGMSANRFLMQCLADFTGLRVAVSSEREATTRGAGLMALVAHGALIDRRTSKHCGHRQSCDADDRRMTLANVVAPSGPFSSVESKRRFRN